jgi:DNA adenine methylase
MQYYEQHISPFLRWAGGKNWFIKHIHKYIPEGGFNTYHEPFLGGGSIFFSIQPKLSYLSDLNEDLISSYIEVRDNVEKVTKELEKFKNTEEFYYYIRDTEIKNNSAGEAAKFIYLNQTSFNGIYRVNLKGKYNVPFGFRTKNFFQPDNLRLASRALRNSKIFASDFTKVLSNIKERDLVFLDPPYTVSHYNNGFIKYNSKLFSEDDQKRLSKFIKEIKDLGAYYIMTNAAHDQVYEIFKENGDQFVTEERASLIGGKNSKRGIYKEAIYTNVKVKPSASIKMI